MSKSSKLFKLASLVMKFSNIPTDKGELIIDGELAIDVDVMITDENGEVISAPDGDYLTEDKKTIVVKDGKVVEIKETDDEPVNNECTKKVQLAEQSYTELMQKIHNAIGGENYVIDVGDGWAVVNVYDDDKEIAYRYTYSLDAEGNVILGDKVEVHPRYVTDEEAKSLQFADENPDEKDAQIKELETKITELEGLLQDRDAIISELTNKIKDLEDKKPVEEAVKMSAVAHPTDNKANAALKYFQD